MGNFRAEVVNFAFSCDVWMTETDGIATLMTLSAYSANCS